MRDELFSDLPERNYYRFTSKDQARRLGQYFTPYPVARFMAEWVHQAPRLRQVMDPAVGLGIFFRAMMDVNPGFQGVFHGFDIDRSMLEQLKRLLPDSLAPGLVIHDRDFLLAEDNERYDGILCNPPYVRYKAVPGREELIRRIEKWSGIALSPYTNLYAYFILRCGQVLAPEGRAAILVPSDFLYSGFGIPVKKYLLQSGLLQYLILFDQSDSLFDEAITTSCILLLQKDIRSRPPSFLTIQRVADLDALARDIACLDRSSVPLSVITPADISPDEKWNRFFYDPASSGEFHRLIPFSSVARAMRGIACGDNRFFTFSKEKIARSGIPNSLFLPCLTRASQATQPFFTKQDFFRLAEGGKPVFLLDACRNPDHPAVRAYLEEGVQNGSHLRYLTRNRLPWYRLESRPPAPILATTFNRSELRFVRNEASVRNLTCFHSIYIRPELEAKTDLLMAYLLTPLARLLIRRNRRTYGDGLVKYEPGDLNTALIADLISLPAQIEREILDLFGHYRRSCLDENPNKGLVEGMDILFREWMQKA